MTSGPFASCRPNVSLRRPPVAAPPPVQVAAGVRPRPDRVASTKPRRSEIQARDVHATPWTAARYTPGAGYCPWRVSVLHARKGVGLACAMASNGPARSQRTSLARHKVKIIDLTPSPSMSIRADSRAQTRSSALTRAVTRVGIRPLSYANEVRQKTVALTRTRAGFGPLVVGARRRPPSVGHGLGHTAGQVDGGREVGAVPSLGREQAEADREVIMPDDWSRWGQPGRR
jgi:hypothetical protein